MDDILNSSPSFLRGRRNAKWNRLGTDVLAVSVGDMDFPVSEAIQAAVGRLYRESDYGYPSRDHAPAEMAVAAAYRQRMARLHGWEMEMASIQPVTDIVQALAAVITAFTEPGDGVIVQTPCYGPLRALVTSMGRRLIANPLVERGGRLELDLEGLAAQMDKRVRLWILVNPHNPSGRVFERAELEAVNAFAAAHDLLVATDELDSELIYPGRRFMPFATLSEDARARTITVNSPTRSFNIAGLRAAVMQFGTPELFARLRHKVSTKLFGKPSIVGIDAAVAAWESSDDWLAGVMRHLETARAMVLRAVAEEMPGFQVFAPEATFFAWIRCGEETVDGHARMLAQGVVPLAGTQFDPSCGNFVRINFATSLPILSEVLTRMARAA